MRETVEIPREIKEALTKCYNCAKCISGCPVASEMDFPPALIVKWLALGEFEKLLKSNTIWVCSSCQNCYSRCPFDINIPHIIDMLKEYAHRNGLAKEERAIRLFHKIFLSCIRRFGRIYEAGLIGGWKIFSGKWFCDLGLGMKMFRKGKLNILPEKVKDLKEVKGMFK